MTTPEERKLRGAKTRIYSTTEWLVGLKKIGQAVCVDPLTLGNYFRNAKHPPLKLYGKWHVPRVQVPALIQWLACRPNANLQLWLSKVERYYLREDNTKTKRQTE